MSFSHNFKLNKNKKVGQPWWPRKNKHSIATADGSKSTIANMEQATESSSNASAQYTIKKPLIIYDEEKTGRPRSTNMDEGTTSEIGVQCDDAISDTLEENTQRIQTRMHHIRQTMIDHYSTLVWCEHRNHPKLAMVYIDAYVILMDQLFLRDEASSGEGAVNISQETREEFQRNILPHQEKRSSTFLQLPAECILTYQEIIYSLLVARGIITSKNLPRYSISHRDTPTTVLLKMGHKQQGHHHNKRSMRRGSANSITVSILMMTIIICAVYYVLFNV